METLYGGIDIHKEKLAGCIMDKDGTITREHTFPSSRKALERFLTGIPNAGTTIAIEACGMWRGTHKILTDMGYDVKLANPKKIHDIACKKKTDRADAKILTDLVRTKYLPEIWIPDEHTLKFRDLTRHKATLTRLKTQIQCKIKSYQLRKGAPYSKHWNKNTLAALTEEEPDIRNLITIYTTITEEEKEVMKRIKQLARQNKETTLLMTIPGIAEFSSLMILAEIGDIHRFKTPKELISYAGLYPGVYQSATTERTVRNTAVNKWLKWIIYECSGRAITLDPRFQHSYYPIQKRKGQQTARRSTARKMLTIIWYILTNQEPYKAS